MTPSVFREEGKERERSLHGAHGRRLHAERRKAPAAALVWHRDEVLCAIASLLVWRP